LQSVTSFVNWPQKLQVQSTMSTRPSLARVFIPAGLLRLCALAAQIAQRQDDERDEAPRAPEHAAPQVQQTVDDQQTEDA
jgi:hypothetical protein